MIERTIDEQKIEDEDNDRVLNDITFQAGENYQI
jgi:hypothetical protein